MSLEKIHLRRALQMLYADDRLQRSLLLKEIREDRRKDDGDREGGGDFYSPFWADVKGHIAGKTDILEKTAQRIVANGRRSRLYPLLARSFLGMWEEKMRWRNEPFKFYPQSIKARLPIAELGTVIKIENTLAVEVYDGSSRIIYPYFSEEPALAREAARLSLWSLRLALPTCRDVDFRIVDILRQAYFRPTDVELDGNERELFVRKFGALMQKWRKLRDER